MLEAIILSAIVGAVVALILGIVITITAKFFVVEVDPRIEEVKELLPGIDCGGCGMPGCGGLAKAVVAGKKKPDACPVCTEVNLAKISTILGIEAGSKEKTVAIVMCGGQNSKLKSNINYDGVNDCKSAALVAGGPKACEYGCLGLASCVRACPFDAIKIIDGLATVLPNRCKSCGKCIEACPRNLIKIVPESAKVHIFCSSQAKGPAKMKKCAVPCIGCGKCVKVAEEGQMIKDGTLVKVNYDNPPSEEIIEKAGCPTNALKTHCAILEN